MFAATDEPVGTIEPRGFVRLSTIATIAAGLGAIGGLLIHLIGVTVSESLFEQWGLDAAMFPKPTDVILVQGYYALISGLVANVLGSVFKYWLWLVLFGALIGGVSLAMSWLDKVAPRTLPGWLARRRQVIVAGVMLLTGVGITAIMFPLAIFTVVAMLAMPVQVGNEYGKLLFRNQVSAFSVGCNQQSTSAKCMTATKGGESVAVGFLIAASDSHVALYDPTDKQTVVLERAGLTLRSGPKGSSHPPSPGASK